MYFEKLLKTGSVKEIMGFLNLYMQKMSDSFWYGRAMNLFEAVITVQVLKRDRENKPITVTSIRDGLILSNIYSEWCEAKKSNNEEIEKILFVYLMSLPTFNPDVPLEKQEHLDPINEQHGHLFMQCLKILHEAGKN